MKPYRFTSFQGAVIFTVTILATTAAETNTQISRAELIARRDAAKEHAAQLRPKDSAEAPQHPSRSSILDRSILLTNGRYWTFVPKGAVLCSPEKHQERVNVSEGKGKYVPFTDFVLKNRGWLSTHNVTFEQARGNDAISEEVRKALNESGRVVVSVCKGGAISTRSPRVSEVTAQN